MELGTIIFLDLIYKHIHHKLFNSEMFMFGMLLVKGIAYSDTNETD